MPPGEIIAVYEEKPVRTYGLAVSKGYVLVGGVAPADCLEEAAEFLSDWQLGPHAGFCACQWRDDRLEISLCLPRDIFEQEACSKKMPDRCSMGEAQPVGLIHLQGPHFGDRYGIINEALSGLAEVHVEPLAVHCAVHSLFVVVPEDQSDLALTGLNKRFLGPG